MLLKQNIFIFTIKFTGINSTYFIHKNHAKSVVFFLKPIQIESYRLFIKAERTAEKNRLLRGANATK